MKLALVTLVAGLALAASSEEYSYIVSGTPTEPAGVSDESDPTEVNLALRTSSASAESALDARGRTFLDAVSAVRFRSTPPTGAIIILR